MAGAGNDASWITGQSFGVDGDLHNFQRLAAQDDIDDATPGHLDNVLRVPALTSCDSCA